MTFEILKECTWAALYIKSTCTAAIVSIFDIICVKFSLEKIDPHVFSRTFFQALRTTGRIDLRMGETTSGESTLGRNDPLT